jgi:tetratricopeptide (TPR) repeat protein
MTRVHPRLLLALTLSVPLIGGAGVMWLRARGSHGSRSIEQPRYVGDQSCRTCHQTIYDSYQRTAMGRSWSVPTSENTFEDYTENNHVYDSRRDLHYELLARDGRFFQREYRLEESGAVAHELLRQVTYIVGSGDHVRSYATDSGGYLTEMPVCWFTDKKMWELSPGYEKFNQRFDRVMVPWCVACHNSYPQHVEATLNQYKPPMPAGIGCERCHGPAEWHVRVERDGWEPAAPLEDQAMIVNPARLTSDRKHDVCFQCHLQGDVQFINPGQEQFGFRPGLRLADFRSDFLVEGTDPAQFGIASHAVRMVQSRCFVASDGTLSCITCHDPHVPLSEVPAQHYRQRCLSCHRPDACGRCPDSAPAEHGNDCVSCHMARGQPSDVLHAMYTDHWIRRPRLDPDKTEAVAEAGGFIPLRDFWNDPHEQEEREGIAHLSLFFARGNRPNLNHGMKCLTQAAVRGALHRDGWRNLGMGEMARGDMQRASDAFSRALRADPTDAVSRMYHGFARRASGDLSGALASLEQAIQIAPDQLEAYLEASRVYLDRDQPDHALPLLQESLRRNPFQPETLATLGSLHSRTGDAAQAIEDYRRAIQLDPDNPAIRVALGRTYERQNELDLALRQFQYALRIGPSFIPALQGMIRLNLARGETAQAVERLRRVLEIDPQHMQTRRLLEQLGVSLESPGRAEEEKR